jgi:hypothetical protein
LKSTFSYNQLIALIFFAAIFAQTFSKVFIVADYFGNTGKYAKNCINKAKPKMRCNGKCQMMKKLKQEEEKDQQNQERKNQHESIVLSSKSFFPSINFSILSTVTLTYSIDNVANEQKMPRSIFHPPSA